MKALFPSAVAAWIAAASGGPAPSHWPAWVERLGWTLVHSIWELAAVALLAAIADYGVRRASAGVRYNTAAVALGIMLLLPGVTWMCVAVDRPAAPRLPTELPVASRPAQVVIAGADSEGAIDLPGRASDPSKALLPTPARVVAPAFDATKPSPPALAAQAPAPARNRQGEGWPGLGRWLYTAVKPRLPWLVGVWLTGVVLGALRPICGIWAQWHLRRCGLSPVPEVVAQTFAALVHKMRISRSVRIAQSTLVRVPLVIGYLRPLILLPACVVTGLTPAQLEAVLAHELAHVRRHDWLINALQVLAETVLFYHPAVWWISRRLRDARELCCDDLALGLTNNRAAFARALLVLEELRQLTPVSPRPATALAATGGQLSDRVRRLLPVSAAPEQTSRSWLLGAMLLLSLGIGGGVSLVAAPPADSRPTKPAAVTKDDDRNAAPDKAAADNTIPQRVVNVVNEKGQPVAGATVRFQFEVSAENRHIVSNPVKTDAQGAAHIEIPKAADRVLISVTAAGFGESTARESAHGKSTIALEHGRVIRVRAVDSAKRVLKDAVPLLAGSRVWGREFTSQADGVYQSPSVALARKLLRVAAAQKEGPMLFSDPVDVSTAKPGRDGVFELTLRPGVRLDGRLDDAVPRPITEGYVELAIVEGEQGKLYDGELWSWHDFTPVRPDGTFTFESLPGGGHAQLHVLVNGSISKNPTIEELLAYLRQHDLVDEQNSAKVKESVDGRAMWPRLVPLDQPRVAVSIPCEPTAACDFRLLDPSGKPVPDASVSFNPNGVFLFDSLFIPGWEMSQALLVDGLRTGNLDGLFGGALDPSPHGQEGKKRSEWAERWFLGAKSDAEGRVRVRNLPGGERETFRVATKGLALPVSPLLNDDDLARRNATDDRDRYGLVELVAGETIEKTIYLERTQSVVDRELIVVNRKGKPLPNVELAVAELRVGTKDWQTWSTQRFGQLPKGTTDGLGRLTLRLPSAVDNVAVQRVRLGVNYSPDRNDRKADDNDRAEELFVHRSVVEIPLMWDHGVIVLLPNQERPNTKLAIYPSVVRYGRLEELLPNASLADWLATLIKEPNLAVLRKLLAGAKMKYPEPAELLDSLRRNPLPTGEEPSRVKVVSDGTNKYAIVEARVRPLSGVLARESDPRELPECAYVFDMQGNLVAALGGELGTTGSSSPDTINLVNLGPEEDWFVRVERFEKKGSFEYLSTYYRIATPIVHSLQVFHYANSGSWSNGPEKLTRFGTLGFAFPETKPELRYRALGTSADGVAVLPTLVWDADRNRFVGTSSQRLGGRPLFEVDTAWSQDFLALSPKSNQLVIDGGEREYDHWYAWNMAVAEGCEALVKLSTPHGGPLFEKTLGPGRQMVQFQLKPAGDGATTKLKLWISDLKQPDQQEKREFDLPHRLGEPPTVHPAIVHTLNPQETARLLDRALTTATEHVTIDVKLLSR